MGRFTLEALKRSNPHFSAPLARLYWASFLAAGLYWKADQALNLTAYAPDPKIQASSLPHRVKCRLFSQVRVQYAAICWRLE